MSAQSIPLKQNHSRMLVLLALLGIVILAAALRLYRIGTKTIWLDEGFSIWMGGHSLRDVVYWSIEIDQHPPLYYLLLSLWIQIGGTGAAWVRSLSALAGVLTIPVIYFTGKRLSDDITGLIAAFILAINPFQVAYGQEARVYAFLTLNAILALYMTARLLTESNTFTQPIGSQLVVFFRTWRRAKKDEDLVEKNIGVGSQLDFRWRRDWVKAPTERRWFPLHLIKTDLTWFGYMVFTAGTVYCHNTAVFFPLGINLFVIGLMIWRRFFPAGERGLQPPSFRNWFWAQIGAGLIWSPWLVAFITQISGVYGEFWIPKPTLQIVQDTLKSFFSDSLPQQFALHGLVWGFFIAILAMGVIHFRKNLPKAFLLLVAFMAPFLGELLVSIWRPIFYVRTLIYAPIPLYLLMAAGIRQLRFRPFIAATLVVLVTFNSFSLKEFYYNFQKEAWDKAAAFVARNVLDGDIIVFNAGWTQIPFDYYFSGYHKLVEEFGSPETLFEYGILEPIMREKDVPRLRTILLGRQRVWLVYSHFWYTDPDLLVIGTLREELKQLRQAQFYGVEIYLFGVR